MSEEDRKFFRPWGGDDGDSEDEETADNNVPSAQIAPTNDENTVKREVNGTVNVKCEEPTTDEDTGSATSPQSAGVSERGNYERAQPEPGSLDLLSNFVYGRQSTVENVGPTIEKPMVSNSGNSSSEPSPYGSDDSPKSAFTPTYYRYPVYTSLNYFSPFAIGNPENAAAAAAAAAAAMAAAAAASYEATAAAAAASYEATAAAATASFETTAAATTASFEATYSHPPPPHHQQLMYPMPGTSRGTYGNSIEEAVKYIHQQDAAAKEIKKLRPKKFRCEYCNVAFSNNGQLKGHIRIHTGERPFKCDHEGCGKSFTRNEELTRHKRIHTGLRPHPCVICGKRFGRKDHLKKHTRTHENRATYQIPAAALAPYTLGHPPLPPGYPMAPYMYPM